MAPGSVVSMPCAYLVLALATITILGGATNLSILTTPDPDDLSIGWETWLAWSDCTKSCGDGDRLRVRLCRSFNGTSGGNSSECTYALPVDGNDTIGYLVEMGTCNQGDCPVDGEWAKWSNWSDCSATCDKGSRNRKRLCEGRTQGGSPCPGSPLEVESCILEDCPVDNEPVVPPPGARNNMEVEITQSDKRPSAITLGSFVIVFMVLECIVLLLADFIGIIKFCSTLKSKMQAKARAKAKVHDSSTELNPPLDVKEVNVNNE